MSDQTDRELLEMAAKAAGYDTSHPMNRERMELDPPVPSLWIRYENGMFATSWNPLESDADALRLAVKLRLNIEHMETMNRKSHGINCWPVGRGDCGISETDISDYASATRRAIVRAAAAITQGA